jgi:hypothetical protein
MYGRTAFIAGPRVDDYDIGRACTAAANPNEPRFAKRCTSASAAKGDLSRRGTSRSSAGWLQQYRVPTIGVCGPATNRDGTKHSQQNGAVREQDSANIPGKPGGKSGPAVTPPSGTPQQ